MTSYPDSAEKVVAEWRAAMEGVTPGPWYSESVETEGSYGSGEDTTEGFDSYVVRTEAQKHYGDDAVICDALNSGTAEVHEEFDEDGTHAWDEPGRRNMAWIARCSPSGISDLLALIEQQAAELAGMRRERGEARQYAQDVAWLNGKLSERVTALEAEKAGLLDERDELREIVNEQFGEELGGDKNLTPIRGSYHTFISWELRRRARQALSRSTEVNDG